VTRDGTEMAGQMRTGYVAWTIGALLSSALSLGHAHAEDVTCVFVSGSSADQTPELLASFDELLQRKGAARRNPTDDAGCAQRIALRLEGSADHVRVFAASAPPDGREAQRSVTRDPSGPVFRETLAHAMYGAVSPWVDVQASFDAVGALREEAALGLQVLAGVAGAWLGDALPDARAFGGLGVTLPSAFAPPFSLRAGGSLPRSVEIEPLSAKRHTLYGRALVGLKVVERGTVRLYAQLATGVDVFALRTTRAVAGYRPHDAGQRALPSTGIALRAEFAASAHVAIALEAGCDVALRRLRFVLRDGDERVLSETPRFLPFLQLTASFERLVQRQRPAEVAP
jgi:hypothetical protein